MMMPSIFGENLFDDFMDFPFDDKWEKRMNKEFLEGRIRCTEKMRHA